MKQKWRIIYRYDKPNPRCVHILVHSVAEIITPIITHIGGYKDAGVSLNLAFSHLGSQSRNPIKTGLDVLDMFNLNSMCSCIHVYATLLKL